MNNQFTPRVGDIITYSKEEANRLRSPYIGSEHLLLGLIRDGGGKAYESLFNMQVDPKQLKAEIEHELQAKEMPWHDNNVSFNEEASRILKLCILEAKLQRSPVADAEHILLAMMKQTGNQASLLLGRFGVTYDKILEALSLKIDRPRSGFGLDEDEEEEDQRPQPSPTGNMANAQAQTAKTARPTRETPILDNFSTDMTRAAEEGKLDLVVGREKEIERVAQILSRRKKNNPVLIGEPGVGKSAIVEGLALRIVQKKVSRILFNKRVVNLDMASVVAGTKYRGQFEERIRGIV